MKPWKLQHLPHRLVKGSTYDVAILPIGACEPHNMHLPYGTDAYESELVSDLVCEQALAQGGRVVQLPTIPFGVQSNMLDIPLAINVYPSTFFTLIKDIIDSLSRHGIRKLVLFNSHGGNDFLKPFIREMSGRSEMFICVIDWWRVGKDVYNGIFQHPDDHAGELETSIMLALMPELVNLDHAADGASKPTRFEAVNKGWVSISRPWSGLTESTGVGDPRQATREKGERYLNVIVPRLAKFIAELAQADPRDATFPF
ncbi:MAG TPA: creatininase family protein [Tepidisphaeraceae bacterium]|jgi:creatinine amidohydrolase